MTNSVSLPKLLRPDTPSQHMPSPFPDALIGSTYIPRVPFWAYIRHSTSLLNPEPKHAPVDQNTATLKTWPTCCWSCSGSSPHARGAQRHDGQVRGRREGRGGGCNMYEAYKAYQALYETSKQMLFGPTGDGRDK